MFKAVGSELSLYVCSRSDWAEKTTFNNFTEDASILYHGKANISAPKIILLASRVSNITVKCVFSAIILLICIMNNFM
jgi:hypothetical protein